MPVFIRIFALVLAVLPSLALAQTRLGTPLDLLNRWTAQQHVYLTDRTIDEAAATELESWVRQNGPTWTVVLVNNCDAVHFTTRDGRAFSGAKGLEYAIGQGLMGQGEFSKQQNALGEPAGVVFAICLKERQFLFFGEAAYDRRGLGEARWANNLDQDARSAMRQGGNMVRATKDTIAGIERSMRNYLARESDARRNAEVAAQHAKEQAGKQLASVWQEYQRISEAAHWSPLSEAVAVDVATALAGSGNVEQVHATVIDGVQQVTALQKARAELPTLQRATERAVPAFSGLTYGQEIDSPRTRAHAAWLRFRDELVSAEAHAANPLLFVPAVIKASAALALHEKAARDGLAAIQSATSTHHGVLALMVLAFNCALLWLIVKQMRLRRRVRELLVADGAQRKRWTEDLLASLDRLQALPGAAKRKNLFTGKTFAALSDIFAKIDFALAGGRAFEAQALAAQRALRFWVRAGNPAIRRLEPQSDSLISATVGENIVERSRFAFTLLMDECLQHLAEASTALLRGWNEVQVHIADVQKRMAVCREKSAPAGVADRLDAVESKLRGISEAAFNDPLAVVDDCSQLLGEVESVEQVQRAQAAFATTVAKVRPLNLPWLDECVQRAWQSPFDQLAVRFEEQSTKLEAILSTHVEAEQLRDALRSMDNDVPALKARVGYTDTEGTPEIYWRKLRHQLDSAAAALNLGDLAKFKDTVAKALRARTDAKEGIAFYEGTPANLHLAELTADEAAFRQKIEAYRPTWAVLIARYPAEDFVIPKPDPAANDTAFDNAAEIDALLPELTGKISAATSAVTRRSYRQADKFLREYAALAAAARRRHAERVDAEERIFKQVDELGRDLERLDHASKQLSGDHVPESVRAIWNAGAVEIPKTSSVTVRAKACRAAIAVSSKALHLLERHEQAREAIRNKLPTIRARHARTEEALRDAERVLKDHSTAVRKLPKTKLRDLAVALSSINPDREGQEWLDVAAKLTTIQRGIEEAAATVSERRSEVENALEKQKVALEARNKLQRWHSSYGHRPRREGRNDYERAEELFAAGQYADAALLYRHASTTMTNEYTEVHRQETNSSSSHSSSSSDSSSSYSDSSGGGCSGFSCDSGGSSSSW